MGTLGFCLAGTLMAFSQSGIQYSLREGFESGIPTAWTQEHVSGEVDWIVEEDGIDPVGAVEGQKRAVLRNTSNQTQGFVTRLVSPVMDLSREVISEPILIFSHAQEHDLGDVDELRVYFRTGESAEWGLLAEYTDRIRDWQTDTIRLVNVSKTYQVAFEGTDKFGKGIVLDNVQVRPLPVCTQPEILNISGTADAFTIEWDGSFDTQKFLLRISNAALDDVENADPADLVVDTETNLFSHELTGMQMNQTYYCYVKAICSDEESEWSAPYMYRTKSMLTEEDLPYEEDFNRDYDSQYNTQEDSWTWGHNMKDVGLAPFINATTSESQRGRYSRDGSSCVVFASSVSSTVPAKSYSYIASPELQMPVQELQISFWGSVYNLFGADYAASLMVGVMTDAEDVLTFVPVDTVTLSKANFFEEFTVNFSSYQGEGKYIALASYSQDKKNAFFLDDVRIEKIPACAKVSEVSTKNIMPTSATVTWKAVENATSYKVLVTTEETENPDAVENAVLTQDNLTTNSFDIPEGKLTSWTDYYVYVQATAGQEKGKWSNAWAFKTSYAKDLPFKYTFEPDIDGTYSVGDRAMDILSVGLYAHSLGTVSIINSKSASNAYKGEYYLNFGGDPGNQAYVSLPAVESVKDVRISFYARVWNTILSDTILRVGIMTDYDDYSAFKSYKEVSLSTTYRYFEFDFSEYEGTGKYIAFAAPDDSEFSIYIDEVTLMSKSGCISPSEITVEPTADGANFTWENVGTDYQLKVSERPLEEEELNADTTTLAANVLVEGKNTCSVEGLLPNQKTYYYYIRTVCSEGENSFWSVGRTFQTACLPKQPLPYVEDFNAYTQGSAVEEIPGCWETVFAKNGSEYNPHIVGPSSYLSKYEGSSLNLKAYKTGPIQSYVILPEMDASINELQISFVLNQTTGSSKLAVGVISDVTDTTTFEPVAILEATANENNVWRDAYVSFKNYQGSNGRIMLKAMNTTMSQSSNMIDLVMVDYDNGYVKPLSLSAKDVTNTSATLYWDGLGGSKWDLMILNAPGVTPLTATAEQIAVHQVVEGNSEVTITSGLEADTEYYYFLRTICGTDSLDWTIAYGQFRTVCSPATTDEQGVETFDDESRLTCWTFFNNDGSENNLPSRYFHLNSAALEFDNGTSTTSPTQTNAVMPPIEIDDIRTLQVTFDVSTEDLTKENRVAVGIFTALDDNASYRELATIEVPVNRFETHTVRFDTYTGDYDGNFGKFVTFRSEGQGNTFFLDNVRLDTISECREPLNVTADPIAATTATLTWEADATGNYELVVSPTVLTEEALNAGTVEAITVSGKNTYDLTGLQPATTYYVYARTMCSGDVPQSRWSNERMFTTACPETYGLPYQETFDAYGTLNTSLPPCWATYYGTEEAKEFGYPYCRNAFNNTYDGVASLAFYAGEAGVYCMAVSPAMDLGDLSQTILSFDVLQTKDVGLVVGLTDDPTVTDPTSILPVGTVRITEDFTDAADEKWYSYRYDLSQVQAEAGKAYKHIVFVQQYDITKKEGYIYLDNLEVAPASACAKPGHVKVGKVRDTSFEVTWDAAAGVAGWNVKYGAAGFDVQTDGTLLSVDKDTAAITGLQPGTAYDVYVQIRCEAAATSTWVGPLAVTTLQEALTDFPYACGFENEAENAKWVLSNGTCNNGWYIGTGDKQAGDKGLYISMDGGQTAGYGNGVSSVWAWRTVYLEPGNYAVSFDWKCMGETPNGTLYNDYLRAGFLPADVTFAASTDGADITLPDGTEGSLSYSSSPDEWLALDNGEMLGEQSDWRSDTVEIVIEHAMAGYYNLVFYWENDRDVYTQPSAVVDNVAIEKSPCPAPLNFELVEISDVSAKLAWERLDEAQQAWSVKVFTEEVDADAIETTEAVFSATPAEPACDIPNLTPNTEYYVYVSATCLDEGGDWVMFTFATPCAAVEVDEAYWGFEDDDISSFDCWIVGNKNSTSSTYRPAKEEESYSSNYSRSDGGNGGTALEMNSTSSADGAYAILPRVNGDMNELQLHFHARAAYARKSEDIGQGYKISLTYTSSTYAHSIIVGTVTDPTDINTFVPLATKELQTLTTSQYAHEGNNWLFDDIVVPLAGAQGDYVAFLSEFGKSNRIYIDDVRIEPVGGCQTPTNVQVGNLQPTTVDVTWQSNGEGIGWVVRVATDEDMTDVVCQDTVQQPGTHTVKGLNPGTSYWVDVLQLCEAEACSEWALPATFFTPYSVLFAEPFSESVACPANWARCDAPKFEGDVLWEKFEETPYLTWERSNEAMMITVEGTMLNDWLITPPIILPEEENLWLTFDVALTEKGSQTPLSGANLNGSDDRFVVVVSDDNGETWKQSNATEWNNQGTGKYVYNDIATYGENVQIELAQYAGKTVKVGFYVESTLENAACDLYVDNVRINRYVKESHEAALCYGEDFREYGFDLTYDALKAGEQEYSRLVLSDDTEVADSLVTVTLMIADKVERIINDSMCAGDIYEKYGFVVSDVTGSQVYKQKGHSLISKCDSITTLNIKVIEPVYETVYDTICLGQTYTFNGVEYDRSDEYTDTIASVVTGCDSIVTLYLHVKDAIRQEEIVTLCFEDIQDGYTFAGVVYSEPGHYSLEETLRTDEGCDVIHTVDLTIHEEIEPTIIPAVTCPNEPYSGNGFTDVPAIARDYERHEVTADGCDSLVILRLTVLDADTIYYADTITLADLPFTTPYGTTYEADTPVGTYRDTVSVESPNEECSSIVVSAVTIEESNGIWNPSVESLYIIPTIISTGQSVQVSAAGYDELELEVYDMTGRRIYRQDAVEGSIELDVFSVSGIYTIRAVDADDKMHYGRVIVK